MDCDWVSADYFLLASGRGIRKLSLYSRVEVIKAYRRIPFAILHFVWLPCAGDDALKDRYDNPSRDKRNAEASASN